MPVIDTSMDFPNNCHECDNSKCVKSRIPWVTKTKDYRTDRHSCCPLKSIDEMIAEIEQVSNSDWFPSVDVVMGERQIKRKILKVINKYCDNGEL